MLQGARGHTKLLRKDMQQDKCCLILHIIYYWREQIPVHSQGLFSCEDDIFKKVVQALLLVFTKHGAEHKPCTPFQQMKVSLCRFNC